MARVPYLDISPPEGDPRRHVTNVGRALANSPGASKHSNAMAMYIRHHSKLDPRLREMAIIQVGYLANSPYEYSHHCEIGLNAGVSEADIKAVADETIGKPTHLEPLAKSVLRAAREMTRDIALSDETFAELEAAFDREQLVDLLIAISNYNGVVRILAALKVDVEPEYRKFLEKFPLAKA
jgi:alkylhydroperoxidase family enzyme